MSLRILNRLMAAAILALLLSGVFWHRMFIIGDLQFSVLCAWGLSMIVGIGLTYFVIWKRWRKEEICFDGNDKTERRQQQIADEVDNRALQQIFEQIKEKISFVKTSRGVFIDFAYLVSSGNKRLYQLRLYLLPNQSERISFFEGFPAIHLQAQQDIILNFRLFYRNGQFTCLRQAIGQLMPHGMQGAVPIAAVDVNRRMELENVILSAIREFPVVFKYNSSVIMRDIPSYDIVFGSIMADEDVVIAIPGHQSLRLKKGKQVMMEIAIDPLDNILAFKRVSWFEKCFLAFSIVMFGSWLRV